MESQITSSTTATTSTTDPPLCKKSRTYSDSDSDHHHLNHHACYSNGATPPSPPPPPITTTTVFIHDASSVSASDPLVSSSSIVSVPINSSCQRALEPSAQHDASERESFATNIGSNSKACLKFYSTSGCPYGESCHFSHYVPGGVASLALSQTSSFNKSGFMGSRKDLSIQALSVTSREQGSMATAGGFKTRLCKNFESSEGCRFGPKCHFAHGEQELKKSDALPSTSTQSQVGKIRTGTVREDRAALRGFREPTPPGLSAVAAFGAISTANVSINSSIAGFIIGKGGVNLKAISRTTGAKLFIRDHESDPNIKNVEMQGSFDQIGQASSMVREMLANKNVHPIKPGGVGTHAYKSKLCENFPKGACTYGGRCHFAHGQGYSKPDMIFG